MKTQASSTRVDTKWFKGRLEVRGISMRRAATVMGMDVSAVSLMLNGKRHMQAAEVGALARVLQVPVEEVLTHAGVSLPVDRFRNSAQAGWTCQECKHVGGGRIFRLAKPGAEVEVVLKFG